MQTELSKDESVLALIPVLEQVKSFAKGLIIRTAEGYEAAAARLKEIKASIKQVEDARTRITKPMNDALKETNRQAKAASEPWEAAERDIKRAMIGYSDEQERLRREAQRIANEKAEKERQRLQAIAREAERKAAEEARAKREAAEKAAAEGRAADAARLAAQAVRVEERAAQKAESFDDRAASVVAHVATQAAPKVSGTTVAKVWTFEIEDESLVPLEYRPVDESRIRAQVKVTKGLTKIPGVRVFEKSQLSSTAA